MPSASCILDTRRPNKEGKYPVKIRITHKGERRYYGFKNNLIHEDDWKLVNQAKPPRQFTTLKQDMDIQQAEALQVIRKLPDFTFAAYDQIVNPKAVKPKNI